jgi:hypothetical protein
VSPAERFALLLAALPLLAGAAAGEARERCAARDPLRRPFFGDTHVHTAFSFDAATLGVRNTPADAYRFARGEEVGLQPYAAEGRPLRSARLERPLDFAVVTDHAELLGETRVCLGSGGAGHDALVCRIARRWPLLAYVLVNSRMLNVSDPERYRFCGEGGRLCIEAADGPWREIQAAAEAAYDRSAACRFTSFVGYEWSGAPGGYMIHRNVVFRNERVPARPVSYVEDRRPEDLWRKLEQECLAAGSGCDVLTIPHNSNLSAGTLFAVETAESGPLGRAAAERRAALEPLVEVMQHKGDSECRVEPLGGGSEDELCAFEKLPFTSMTAQRFPFLWEPAAPRAYVREALGEGLVQQARIGANPFKYGIIGATDSHMGTPGLVDERDFPGGAAGGDTSQVAVPAIADAIWFNPGGLAGLWAEENSRDALFEAMRRREAWGTSGPRITVRFFGGWDLAEDLCGAADFAARGYEHGVPMGGELSARGGVAGPGAPVFAVWALRDPGSATRPSVPLQRVQVVKLWEQDGRARERVYEVAGDPENGADVDLAGCEPRGAGADQLCATWRDPDFDPARPALWYARVVENPSCRWLAWQCSARGVDCADPTSVPAELAACCDARVPPSVQERAWTSPIWYTPPQAGARTRP